MKKLSFLLFILFLPLTEGFTQNLSPGRSQPGSFIQLESGLVYPGGKIRESVAIRQNINSYYVDYISQAQISSGAYGYQLGLKWGYSLPSLKAGISCGMRFTAFRTEITGFSSDRSDFFYLRYSESGNDTRFARVKKIQESNNYLSLPVEISYVALEYQKFSLFLKIGSEIGFLNFLDGADIEFSEPSMEIHQEDILNKIGKEKDEFYTAFYSAIGLKIANPGKTGYMVEFLLPSFYLNSGLFSLTKVQDFTGFRFSILLPFNSEKSSSYEKF